MTGVDPGHNRLAVLAAEIRAAHADVARSALAVAERALAAGRMLLEAKAAVPHGNWASWLETSAGLSARTARRYMQLVKSGMETATVADLGIKAAARKLVRSRIPHPPSGHFTWGITDSGLGLLIWPVGADRYHVVCAPTRKAKFDEILVTDKPIPAELVSNTVIQTGFPIGTTPLHVYRSSCSHDHLFEGLRNYGLGGDWPLAEATA